VSGTKVVIKATYLLFAPAGRGYKERLGGLLKYYAGAA
jgi:hypothetical protein